MRGKNSQAQKTQMVFDMEKTRKLFVIDQILTLIDKEKGIDDILLKACEVIRQAYPDPDEVSVRIIHGDKHYLNKGFKESNWLERQTFKSPDNIQGALEIFYSNSFIEKVDKESIIKDTEFLKKVTSLLTGAISKSALSKLIYDNTERLKELRGINTATEILRHESTFESALKQICDVLPQAWQYPQDTVARIIFDDKVYKSERFRETKWMQKQCFETPDKKNGSIEIFYLKQFPAEFEGPFLKEERNLIDNLAALISGTVSKNSLQKLLVENTERLKELREINNVASILKEHENIEDALKAICAVLPRAWQFSEYTAARITHGKQVYMTTNLTETSWMQSQEFETPDNKLGLIEIFYLKEFPKADEGPFLKEERDLLKNIASLISGSAAQNVFGKLLAESRERLKELKAINQTSEIIAEGLPVDETLSSICTILPKSWQYAKHTTARIIFEGKVYESLNFAESIWKQQENFVTIDNKTGSIEIYYLKEFPEEYEGPFLKEERNLLVNIAKLISGYLNNYKGRDFYTKSMIKEKSIHKPEEYWKSLIENKQPLQLFFNKQALDKYIYLDMMKYKVKEILFVATLYDAFVMEYEDNFFEQFMGEIYQFSLYSLPRITGVTSQEEALEVLGTAQFDIAILMVGIDLKSPIELSKKIKEKSPDLPVFLLVNHKNHLKHFEALVPKLPTIDKLFTWNGHSQIFFSIIKSIEDRANAENDTKVGLVRVILLIEDSAFYYSKYLQILYSIIFGQVQQLMPEAEKNELNKISKMRSRPKVIHVRNYEEAVFAFNKYKDFLLCVISDVEFEHEGKLDKQAGINFIKYAKSHIKNLPIILQSAEDSNRKVAEKIGAYFIDKNSENLHYELKKFITTYLYFGDFVFRDKEGNKIAVAKSLREFETLLYDIPEESLLVHATENQFSLWLMSRGEIELARNANPVKISDFETIEDFRHFFINTIKKYKEEKKKGKILTYDETSTLDEKNIVSLSTGSLGGKGRGLAFINALIYNLEFPELKNKINIRTPITAVIGTDEFDNFIRQNQLQSLIKDKNISHDELKKIFVESKLSVFFKRKVQFFIEQVDKPIAIRSSSLSEDSITQPFAGVFDTFIVPNNDKDNIEETLEKVCDAIKLVYASIFSDSAKIYFRSIHHKIEEEKMAIVLQELVGNKYGEYYYPHISGTAQSYNYYPIANMKPEEGFAVAAVGLGFYVVGGNKSYRFSPKYPRVEIFSTKDLLNSTQTEFLAVDLSKNNINYLEEGEMASIATLEISKAEEFGTLNHCASVYNRDNDRIEAGLSKYGPRIINFADILKFDYIPLAQTIDIMLNTIQEALGSPVEIEYAVDLNSGKNKLPSFYLLQIKPLVGRQLSDDIDLSHIVKEKTVLYTRSSLGNGIIENIKDVIYIDNTKFDKLKTLEMVREIEHLNNLMIKQNKRYILIGPGRWGTRDQFLGIPVVWSQISNAKVIIEISLENFPLDSSLGSHFFHNITSMNIGYFSVINTSETDYIRWNILDEQKLIAQTTYFKHVRFEKPVRILMNGKEKTSAITF